MTTTSITALAATLLVDIDANRLAADIATFGGIRRYAECLIADFVDDFSDDDYAIYDHEYDALLAHTMNALDALLNGESHNASR